MATLNPKDQETISAPPPPPSPKQPPSEKTSPTPSPSNPAESPPSPPTQSIPTPDTPNITNPSSDPKGILETQDLEKQPPQEEKKYSSFGPWQKKFIVLAATMGAFFSPLNAQIYFPALTSIAKDLNVSNSQVNLTVTTYMIFQAISPAFVGGFSDTAGRRPAYIICFTIYIAANIALSLQDSYIALLILRMLQSAGSSGTVALANAIVADICTSAERGIYVGITSLASVLAPSLGPVLGGLLGQYAGWQWIFGFLAILAGVFFVPMLLFMPETCRMIVGDGSIPPPKWNRSLMNYMNERKSPTPPDHAAAAELKKKRGPISFPNPISTLIIAVEKESFLILFYAGMIYACFYAVIAALPSQLKLVYGYDELIQGLMFLPIAGGSILSAFTVGKVIDLSFQREQKRLNLPHEPLRQMNLRNFPIEKARMMIAGPVLTIAIAATVGFGWVLEKKGSVGWCCLCLFWMGYGIVGGTQSVSILIVDINPGKAGAGTAAFNLIRCLLGAGGTGVVVPVINAIGVGWAFTLAGGIFIILSPLLWAIVAWGPKWREARAVRDEKKEKEKEASEAETVAV